ncbi:unnamed protein product [Staurois parvus]|uniref:Uncharacterized protein n=1 Tax=Staurois parvus TaxID=386267 RepID=A0ABN9DZD3_9NEOB|nr:unnamed protein product [Staurois parvus]
MYTDYQGTDDQCGPRSATCQYPSVPRASAHQCYMPVPISATSMPHISAYQCTSMPHISAHLSCLSMSPISATYQCLSVLPISASQCCLTVPYTSAAFQCPSVMPVNAACQCPSVQPTSASSSVPPISVHQCSLSVPITAASLAHISEGEKITYLQNCITKTKKKTGFFFFKIFSGFWFV